MSSPVRSAGNPAPTSSGELRWGILATGGIAASMTRDLLQHGHTVSAVGSRSAAGARDFAEQHGIRRAHGSYDDLVGDPEVDAVYVATPHNLHAANALAALDAGKHVLVEKAFTLNATQARAVVDRARDRGLVVLEAMWTRFLPHMAHVRSVIAEGRLGELRSVHADHTQRLPTDPRHRLNALDLAGGALLDLGVYPVSFAHDLLGPPVEVRAGAILKDTGVDASVTVGLRHGSGAVSTSFSSMEVAGSNRAVVIGTGGRLEIDAVWYSPAAVTVFDADGQVVDRYDEPVSGRGMQFQAAELERLVAAGEVAGRLLSPEQSVEVMTTLDAVRAQIGVRYPEE